MHSLSLWGLRGRVLREQARDRLLAQQPQLTDEQREIAVQRWLESRQIRMADELECWMAREGIANDDLAILAERQMRWLLYLEQRYRSAVPTLFLKRKNKLDQVVYSLVWVQDEALATEVFLQLKEEETSFDTLWRQLPPGGDAELPNGRIGPVPWPPKQLGSGFIIVRLDERRPAVLNDVRRQELLIELGDALLQEQLQSPSTDHSSARPAKRA
ncbi:MAG: hypothetical protein EBZ24_12005 [Synechococcaceae bacterium WB9_4xB_025]|nr:hypothetical protein [Synechococcaceae bacterium WB9_4xB_025]